MALIEDQAAHFGGRIIDTTIGYGYEIAQLAKARSQVCRDLRCRPKQNADLSRIELRDSNVISLDNNRHPGSPLNVGVRRVQRAGQERSILSNGWEETIAQVQRGV